MRRNPFYLSLFTFALLAAFSALPARAQDDDFAISVLLGKPGRLSRALQLDADQVDKFRTFAKAANDVAKPLLRTNRLLLGGIQAEFDAASPDTCRMGQLALTRHKNWLQAKAAYSAFDKAFSAILYDAQLATWEALKAGAATADTSSTPFDDGAGNGDH